MASKKEPTKKAREANEAVINLINAVNLLQEQVAALNNTVIGIAIEAKVKPNRIFRYGPNKYKEFLTQTIRPIGMATEALSAQLFALEHPDEAIKESKDEG